MRDVTLLEAYTLPPETLLGWITVSDNDNRRWNFIAHRGCFDEWVESFFRDDFNEGRTNSLHVFYSADEVMATFGFTLFASCDVCGERLGDANGA